MLKQNAQKLMVATIIIILLPFQIPSTTNSTYEKTWTQSSGSKLKITITPDSAKLEAGNVYSYKITFEAIAFASNQKGFYSIAVHFRFENSKNTVKSDLYTNLDDLSNVGSKTQTWIQLGVPPADKFPLEVGESVEGQLQYLLYYAEHPFDWDKSEMLPNGLAFYTERSIGWETIARGQITLSFLNPPSITIIGLITGFLIGSVIAIYYIIIRKESRK